MNRIEQLLVFGAVVVVASAAGLLLLATLNRVGLSPEAAAFGIGAFVGLLVGFGVSR